jgi:hypothetical protein
MSGRDENPSAANRTPGMLGAAAGVLLWVAAMGSAASTLYAGHRNASRILILMFIVWVLAPFAALGWARVRSRSSRRPANTQTALHWLTLAVTLGSLALYAQAAFRLTGIKSTRIFLMTPLASLVAIAIVLGVPALAARRRRQRDNHG